MLSLGFLVKAFWLTSEVCHRVEGWSTFPISQIRQSSTIVHILNPNSATIQAELQVTAVGLKTSGDSTIPLLSDLIEIIPPSVSYNSNQLKAAFQTMIRLLDEEISESILSESITFYLQTLHIACHEILGHVHISLAKDIYDRLPYKLPEWCQLLYEILSTDIHVKDEDLLPVLQDWIRISEGDARQRLLKDNRLDLWDQLNHTSLEIHSLPMSDISKSLPKKTQAYNFTLSPPYDKLRESLPEDRFQILVEKIQSQMLLTRINSTVFFSDVYLAVETLKNIDTKSDEQLRTGLQITSACLLRRDATWIFRSLDQRGVVVRDDIHQLLHVYCNDQRQPFGVNFALSLLSYCESQSERNAYIRRPDPFMYRMVLKAMSENPAYDFGIRALHVVKRMSIRENSDDIDSENWRPVYDDYVNVVSTLVQGPCSWWSLQRADSLVRSLYQNSAVKGRPSTGSHKVDFLTTIGQKLRLLSQSTTEKSGPLYNIFLAYKNFEPTNGNDPTIATLSLFEYILEKIEAGNKSYEEISKLHMLLLIEISRKATCCPFIEVVRLFKRADNLVNQGLLTRKLVSPSVSYQLLSLLAEKGDDVPSSLAIYLYDHYIERAKEPRLAAFQYAIQICCSENSIQGCKKAVMILDRAMKSFRRRSFRDSTFLEILKQIELHDASGRLATKVYDIMKKRLNPTYLDVECRIAIFFSSYRGMKRDPLASDNVRDACNNLSNLRIAHPNHPAFNSDNDVDAFNECEHAPMIDTCPMSSAIDILLSSREPGDIVMAATILEQGESENLPHSASTYQHVIEAFIGINNMESALKVMHCMHKYHPNASQELENVLFSILLSSRQESDLMLAEQMLNWDCRVEDLLNKSSKLIYTYLSINSERGRKKAKEILVSIEQRIEYDNDFTIELRRLVDLNCSDCKDNESEC